MGRTKLPALETADAEMSPGGLGFPRNELEHAHRTEINAHAASVAKDAIHKDLHEDSW